MEARKLEQAARDRAEFEARKITGPIPAGTTLVAGGTMLSIPAGHPMLKDSRLRLAHGTVMDYGRGKVQLGGLTRSEAEMVDRMKGVTLDGRSMVGMTVAEIRAAVSGAQAQLTDQSADMVA